MNSFEVVVLKDIPYWIGTILDFSEINAKEFYNWSKEKDNNVDWNLLQNPVLSRLDLGYTSLKLTEAVPSRVF